MNRTRIVTMLVGAALGLTWGASLRAWMTTLALYFGDRPEMSWEGTFLATLLPATSMGALLGGAYYAPQAKDSKRWRWTAIAPLLLVLGSVIFVEDFIPTLINTGLGGGAIAVTLIGLIGGYAISGRGPLWGRVVAGVICGAFLIALAGGVYFADRTSGPIQPDETFGLLFFILLMGVFIVGASVPYRIVEQSRQR